MASTSLDILALLAHLLDFGFDDDRSIADGDVAGLRENRVRLAVHLLEDEIDALADLFIGAQQVAHLHEMTLESGDLFADVRAVGQQNGFLRQSRFIYLSTALQIRQTFLQALAINA